MSDGQIVDIDVAAEMETSFLEYAYSVIYARALPDARDGLKPVQRRIVYTMGDMGLRPDRPYVKSSRVVGEVMGRQWRRPGDPPVFNREAHEYVELLGRPCERLAVPYPRYKCDLTVLVFE